MARRAISVSIRWVTSIILTKGPAGPFILALIFKIPFSCNRGPLGPLID